MKNRYSFLLACLIVLIASSALAAPKNKAKAKEVLYTTVLVNAAAAEGDFSGKKFCVRPLNEGVKPTDPIFLEFKACVERMLLSNDIRIVNDIDEADVIAGLAYGSGDPEEAQCVVAAGGKEARGTIYKFGNFKVFFSGEDDEKEAEEGMDEADP